MPQNFDFAVCQIGQRRNAVWHCDCGLNEIFFIVMMDIDATDCN